MLTKYIILQYGGKSWSKNKINFAWFTFVYAGNMLFCVMDIFTSR